MNKLKKSGLLLVTFCLLASLLGSCTNDKPKPPSNPSNPTNPSQNPPSKPSEPEKKPEIKPGAKWAEKVDNYFKMKELTKVRKFSHRTDACSESSTFENSVYTAVEMHLEPYKNEVNNLFWAYQIPKDLSLHKETSLISHELCTGFTKSNLTDLLKNVPDQETIDMMNTFSKVANEVRTDKTKAQFFWSRTFGCLAYTESLSTADTPSSYKVAKKFNYDKPLGVKFYDDPVQTEASRYNIGLFQFTPTASGNVNPCLRNWNTQKTDCQIPLKSSQAELVKVFGSGKQVFNAYCGVNKIVGTFAIQQNSTDMRRVFKKAEGQKSGSRCVTPFILSTKGYNHFGPFQNSTKSNLKKLLKCVLSE